jgi:hypothetical protein
MVRSKSTVEERAGSGSGNGSRLTPTEDARVARSAAQVMV